MNADFRKRVHLVLRHEQVLGREGRRVHASVTQIDLHDFSRLTRTYGFGGFHCVTEMEEQHRICAEIMDYWQKGPGQDYNPDRNQALSVFHIHRSFEHLLAQLRAQSGEEPLLIGTSAQQYPEKRLEFHAFSSIMARSARPVLVQFGTSWGLSPEQIDRCDWVFPPIDGYDGYNHLSVRCAAAILVDRLCRTSASETTEPFHERP